MERCDVVCVTVLILKHDLFNYFHIGNVNTQNNVGEPGPQLVVEPPPWGCSPSVMVKLITFFRQLNGPMYKSPYMGKTPTLEVYMV